MVSNNDGWAVGSWGAIYYYNGSVWESRLSPTNWELCDIDMVSTADGWAIGCRYWGGVVLHWDGISWNEIYFPKNRDLFSIDMVSTDTGWIVGEAGMIYRKIKVAYSFLPFIAR
jgi:photosystem II stability/assembly factor-like uncharacterized protein